MSLSILNPLMHNVPKWSDTYGRIWEDIHFLVIRNTNYSKKEITKGEPAES